MSKLDEIFDDLSVAGFQAPHDVLHSLMNDGKKRTKELFLGYLYALKSILEDTSMNSKTPPERVDDVIDLVARL